MLLQGKSFPQLLRSSARVLRQQGLAAFISKARTHLLPQDAVPREAPSYPEWLHAREMPASTVKALERELAGWRTAPLLSVVMPTFNSPGGWLRDAIESVRAQRYSNWELCIADDASTDPQVRAILTEYVARDARIRVAFREQNGHISEASNTAIQMARGDYVVLLDHDDILHPLTLPMVAQAIRNHPDAAIIYSDEDKLNEMGHHAGPYLKSDFNYELLLSHNMISHLGVYARELVLAVGGFRHEFIGSQDYDLALRCIERVSPSQIIHIPKVLYHWRIHDAGTAKSAEAKPYAQSAAARAVSEHLARSGTPAVVENNVEANGAHRLRFALPTPAPSVEIMVMDLGGRPNSLDAVDALARATRYPNVKFTLLDPDPTIPLMRRLNAAAASSNADCLCFLDSWFAPVNEHWLEELVVHTERKNIGAVGARLWGPENRLLHAGIIIGLDGDAGFGHELLPRDQHGHLGRAVLLQEYSAVSLSCLLVKRSVFLAADGFDNAYTGALAGVDFCLRLKEKGFRNIWTPHAELRHMATPNPQAPQRNPSWDAGDRTRFIKRWKPTESVDPAYSPSFSRTTPGFTLA